MEKSHNLFTRETTRIDTCEYYRQIYETHFKDAFMQGIYPPAAIREDNFLKWFKKPRGEWLGLTPHDMYKLGKVNELIRFLMRCQC